MIEDEYSNIKNNITAEEYIEDFRKSFKIAQDEKVNTNFLKELYYEFLIHTFKQSKSEQFIISKLADLEDCRLYTSLHPSPIFSLNHQRQETMFYC